MFSYLDPVQPGAAGAAPLDDEEQNPLLAATRKPAVGPLTTYEQTGSSGNPLLDDARAQSKAQYGDGGGPGPLDMLKLTGKLMLDTNTSIFSNAVALAGEDVAMVPGALAGGMSAAFAAVDGNDKTNALDAFRATLDGVAEWWYDQFTSRALDLGTDTLGINMAHKTYEHVGEGFEAAFDISGKGAVMMARNRVKPAVELLGGEWTPEREAFYYAVGQGTLAALMMALPGGRMSKKAPATPAEKAAGVGTLAKPEQIDAGLTVARMEAVPLTKEEFKQAYREATAEQVQQATAEALWDEAYAGLTPNARNDVQILDFTRYNELHAIPRRKGEMEFLKEGLADDFYPGGHPLEGQPLKKKDRKRMKKRLKYLEKRPVYKGKPVPALPSPEMVDAEYTPSGGGNPHPSFYRRAQIPPMSKEWYRKWVWEGYDRETGSRNIPADEAYFEQAYNAFLDQTESLNTEVIRNQAAYGAEVTADMGARMAHAMKQATLDQAKRQEAAVAGAPVMKPGTSGIRGKVPGKPGSLDPADSEITYWRAPRVQQQAFAGEEAFRSASIQQTEIGFVGGLQKVAERAMAHPELMKNKAMAQEVQRFLQTKGQPVDYGATFREMFEALRRVEQTEAKNRVRLEIGDEAQITRGKKDMQPVPTGRGQQIAPDQMPVGEVAPAHQPLLTDLDRMALLQEYHSLTEASLHPTKGVQRKEHNVSSLGEQIEARHGPGAAAQSAQGFVGATGRFYTPGEAAALRFVVDKVIGMEELVAPLWKIAPSLGDTGGLPTHLNVSVRPGDIPIEMQAHSVRRFGIEMSRLARDEHMAALMGKRNYTAAGTKLRQRQPDPTYPRDIGAIQSVVDKPVGGRPTIKTGPEGKSDNSWIDTDWDPKSARRFSFTPWGERLHKYWEAKDRLLRKEQMKGILAGYGKVADIRRKQADYIAREGMRAFATKGESIKDSLGFPVNVDQVQFGGSVEGGMQNWQQQVIKKKLHALKRNESPSFETLKNVSAESGYPNLREMLRDSSMELLEKIAAELGVLPETFRLPKQRLIMRIVAADRKIIGQRSWAQRAKGDDPYVSQALAEAGTIPAADVLSYLENLAVAESRGVPHPPAPEPRFRTTAEIDKELALLERGAEGAKKERYKDRAARVRALMEKKKAYGPGREPATLAAKKKVDKEIQKVRDERLEFARDEATEWRAARYEELLLERERSEKIEQRIQVLEGNARKRETATVLPDRVQDVKTEMEMAERARKAHRGTIALETYGDLPEVRAAQEAYAKTGKVDHQLRRKAVKAQEKARKAVREQEAAARKELQQEMKAWAQARDVVTASRKSRQRRFNTERNSILRRRAEMGAEGRYMADLPRAGQRVKELTSSPEGAALRAEAVILSGKKVEGLPKDIYAKYLGEDAPKKRPISSRGKYNRQRGAVEAPSDLFGIGGALNKGFKTMAGILKRGERDARVYSKPMKGGRDYQKDAGGVGSNHRFQKAAEVLGGAQSMTPLVRKLREVLDKAGNDSPAAQRLGGLIQDFGVLPSWAWTRVMGSGESFYNLNTKIRGMLLTGSRSEVSLAHAMQKHGAHWFANARDWVPSFMAGTRGGLTKEKNMSLVKQLLGLEEMKEFGQDVRRSLDTARDMMIKAGVEGAPYVKNYFPYMLRRGLSKVDQDRLVDLVMKYGKKAGRRVDMDLVGNQIRGMAGDEGWMRGRMGVRNKRDKARELWSHERVRKLLDVVPPRELLPFIETDAPYVLSKYLRDASSRIAYATKFGANDQKLTGRINLANKELQKLGMSLTDLDRSLIDDLLHITQREYVTPWSEHFTSVQRFGIGVANWAKLGMVVPGSMVELVLPLRNPTFVRHWIPAVIGQTVAYPVRALVRQVYRAPPTKDKGFGTLGYDAVVAEVLGKVVDVQNMDLLHANHAADLGGRLSNAAFIANGLHVMTNVLQTALQKTFRMSSERFLAREMEIRAGKRKRSELHEYDKLMFEYYGLDIDKGIHWIKGGSKMNDPFFTRNYAPAVIKYMQENVLTAQGVNQPKWHANPNLGWLRHLKTYVTMFGNTVTMDLYHRAMQDTFREAPQHVSVKGRNAAAVFGTLAAMYFVALGSEMLMDWWKYGGSRRHPLIERLSDDSGSWASPGMGLRAMNRWAVGGMGGMLLYDLWESGQYNSRGFGDEGVVQDMMSGTVGKDGLRFMMMMLAGLHGLVDDDGNGITADQLGAFAASQTPMVTAMPRTDASPAEEWMPTKEDLAEFYTNLFEEMGL